MIFVIKLRFHEGKRSPVLIGFAFDFLQFAPVKSLKILTMCENCPADYLKSKKTSGFLTIYLILCFLPLSQIWS